jgi:hypothetical protein
LQQLQQQSAADRIPVHLHENPEAVMPPTWQVGLSLQVRIVLIADCWRDDPNHIREQVNRIYEQAQAQLGLAASDLIADYTGGTKSMTVGVVLACTDPERHLQYLVSHYGPDGQIAGSQLMQVKLAYRLNTL